MPTRSEAFAGLSDQDRQLVDQWLADFEATWSPDRWRQQASRMSALSSAVRMPALIEMVRIDLLRRWQMGECCQVERYLDAFPELKTSQDALRELVLAEWQVRRQFGAAAEVRDLGRRLSLDEGELRRIEAELDRAHDGERVRSHVSTVVGVGWSSAQKDTSPPSRRQSAPASSPEPAVGLPERFGRYRVLGRLGEGGMGSVYLAEDTQLERRVALKIPHFRPEDGEEVLERFLREARAAAAFSHPNVCSVYDVGEIDNVRYLAMEYIQGRPLSSYINTDKPVPPRQAAAILRKLALALDEAHRRGVVHRDLKPSNVMINARREPVVMDFGLARRAVQGDVRLTKSGMVIGTPAYMPPEQVAGDLEAIGPPSDIYSLGVTMYELLTGTLPFEGPLASVLGCIMTVDPEPPSVRRPGLDQALEAICLKMMAKKAADRYASMKEAADALGAYLKGTQDTTPPTSRAALPVSDAPIAIQDEDAPLAALFAAQAAGIPKPGRMPSRVRPPWRLRPDPQAVALAWRRMPALARWLTAGLTAVVLLGAITLYVRSTQHAIPIGIDDAIRQAGDRDDRAKTAATDPAVPDDVAAFSTAGTSGRPKGSTEGVAPGRDVPVLAGFGRDMIDPDELGIAIRSDGINATDGLPGLVAVVGSSRLKHWDRVECVAVSPDGRLVASAGPDFEVRTWDARTGALIHEFVEQARSGMRGLEFIDDGRRLLATAYSGRLVVWDVADGRQVRRDELGTIDSFAVSPDGRLMAAASRDDREVRILDLADWSLKHALPIRGDGAAAAIAFSRDGRRLAAGDGNEIIVWDVAAGALTQTCRGHSGTVTSLAFAPDGRWLVSGSRDDSVRLWEADTGADLKQLRPQSSWIFSAAFHPDGKTVAIGGGFGGLFLWNVNSDAMTQLRGHSSSDAVKAVAFSPDGATLVSGCGGGTIKLWDVATATERDASANVAFSATSLAFSPDGGRLAAGIIDGDVFLWESPGGALTREFGFPNRRKVTTLAFHPDGQQLFAGASNNNLKGWHLGDRRELRLPSSLSGGVTALALSPDGEMLAIGTWTGNDEREDLILYDLTTGSETAQVAHPLGVIALSYSPDGRFLASAGAHPSRGEPWYMTASLRDGRTGELIHFLGQGSPAVAFSPDGRGLFLGRLMSLQILEPETAQVLREFPESSLIDWIAISPDGRWLVSTENAGLVHFWNCESGVLERTLKLGRRTGPRDLAFSPDSRHLAVANGNGTIYLFDLQAAGIDFE